MKHEIHAAGLDPLELAYVDAAAFGRHFLRPPASDTNFAHAPAEILAGGSVARGQHARCCTDHMPGKHGPALPGFWYGGPDVIARRCSREGRAS